MITHGKTWRTAYRTVTFAVANEENNVTPRIVGVRIRHEQGTFQIELSSVTLKLIDAADYVSLVQAASSPPPPPRDIHNVRTESAFFRCVVSSFQFMMNATFGTIATQYICYVGIIISELCLSISTIGNVSWFLLQPQYQVTKKKK